MKVEHVSYKSRYTESPRLRAAASQIATPILFQAIVAGLKLGLFDPVMLVGSAVAVIAQRAASFDFGMDTTDLRTYESALDSARTLGRRPA